MKRLATALALSGAVVLAGCGPGERPPETASSAGQAPRPNVLFVLADDLRWDMIRSYGNEVVRTPSLDGLARSGLSFDAFYVANPVCSASRANFLTGRLSHQRGIAQFVAARGPSLTYIEDDTRTVAHWMNEAGYHTGFVGKAHLRGDPLRWGFREAPLYTPGYGPGAAGPARNRFVRDGEPVQIAERKDEQLVDAAIGFVERNRERPWFLWLATTAPHSPYLYHPRHAYGHGPHLRPPGFPPDRPMGDSRSWVAYYSMVSMLDEQLGRLLARLAELELEERTLVIFSSDNGVMHGSHGVLTKAMWYEESVRQPLILRWPGRIEPGRRSRALASSIDLLPTLAELVGAADELPPELRGRSWTPLFREGEPAALETAQRGTVYAESYRPRNLGGGHWEMVVENGFKYVEIDEPAERRLYDLRTDPHERVDRSSEPGSAARVERMRARLGALRTEGP